MNFIKMLKQYYLGSTAFLLIGAIASFFIAGTKGLVTYFALAALETSLSFDNAVVNAKILKDMDAVWKKRFLTWGMVIAVFGMRVVFPLIIVCIMANLNLWEAFMLAVNQPEQYAHILEKSHYMVAGFGGAFLMMVFLKFFIDYEKEVHWVSIVEKPLSKMGKMESAALALTLLIMVGFAKQLPLVEALQFLIAGIFGLVVFELVGGIEGLLETDESASVASTTAKAVVKSGLASFLYLEVLDASFSFDGVLGALIMTNNIFLIALGLGAGAFYVRSMTIQMVDKGTVEAFKYLEHGAFWAIGALAFISFYGVLAHIPEVVTGLIGIGMIALALLHSIIEQKKNN